MSNGQTVNFDTICLLGGHEPDTNTHSRAVPIHQTTSYPFDNTDHAARLFALKEPGYIDTRLMNPRREVLEKRVATAEKGVGRVAFSAGMSGITAGCLTILGQGDHIVASSGLHGGTCNLMSQTFKDKFGIDVTFTGTDDPGESDQALRNSSTPSSIQHNE